MTHPIGLDELNLARHLARRHAPGNDDAESAATLALLLASREWDGRGTFAGYAGQRITWAIGHELRKSHPEPVDTDALPDTTQTLGRVDPDERERADDLHVALVTLRCDWLLDGVDRRRFADRSSLAALRRALE